MNRASYIAAIQQAGDHFTPIEFEIRGDITNIKPEHFEHILKFRKWHGLPTLLTSTWRPNSTSATDQHVKGLATDLIIFKKYLVQPVSHMQAWQLATTWPFNGIGLYFDWHYTNKQGTRVKAPGLHVDNGQLNAGRPLRWLCKEWENKQHYYYQDVKTGLFYNRETNETISLQDAIRNWN